MKKLPVPEKGTGYLKTVPDQLDNPVQNKLEQEPHDAMSAPDLTFDFSLFVLTNGFVFKVGTIYFVDWDSFSFIISHL